MIDLLLRAFVVALIVTAGSLVAPDAQAQHCHCECIRTPHGRACRTVCYASPPRPYVPDHSASYAAPRYLHTGPTVPPELIGLGVLAVIGAILLGLLASFSRTDEITAATDDVRADTAALRGLTDVATRTRDDLEEAMERLARDSFDRGRRDAEAQFGDG